MKRASSEEELKAHPSFSSCAALLFLGKEESRSSLGVSPARLHSCPSLAAAMQGRGSGVKKEEKGGLTP